jgi:aminodeoxyfutalosine synthase
MQTPIFSILSATSNKDLVSIAEKIINNQRINEAEGLLLFEKGDLGLLGALANYIREKKNGDKTYFNRNFHIEPTNICIYSCKFCSYVRKPGEPGAWEYSLDEIIKIAESYRGKQVTEVHIVGGVHPRRDLHYYGNMISKIKEILPEIHVKAFTAIELDFMIKKAKVPIREGLLLLKSYGLDSIPGGGAEIFDPEIRKQVCNEKSEAEMWLNIHRTAHQVGIPSNATILYGHIEQYHHRISHMKKLRDLQDETGLFNTFIPLKYREKNNKLSSIGEVSTIEDLKNYAVSRIFLDNFDHIKAYWPMIGKHTTQLSLSFGVDDIDGTIDDSTKIYTMAGVEDSKPIMTIDELTSLIREVNRTPIERDTLYNVITDYSL